MIAASAYKERSQHKNKYDYSGKPAIMRAEADAYRDAQPLTGNLRVLRSLTDDEYRAWAAFERVGYENAYAFPAPVGCRSLEDWMRHGDDCWRRLRAKVYRTRSTAWDSPMLAVRA